VLVRIAIFPEALFSFLSTLVLVPSDWLKCEIPKAPTMKELAIQEEGPLSHLIDRDLQGMAMHQ